MSKLTSFVAPYKHWVMFFLQIQMMEDCTFCKCQRKSRLLAITT